MTTTYLYDLKTIVKEFMAFLITYTFRYEDTNNLISNLLISRFNIEQTLISFEESKKRQIQNGSYADSQSGGIDSIDYDIHIYKEELKKVNSNLNDLEINLEKLLYNLVLATIENNTNALIRRKTLKHFNLVKNFCMEYKVDSVIFHNALIGMTGYKAVLDSVNSAMVPNSFIIWSLKNVKGQYMLKEVGDFRILQWEEDHVKNGKYFTNKIK